MLTELQASCGPEGVHWASLDQAGCHFGSGTGLLHKSFCQDPEGRSNDHLRQDIFMVEIKVPEEVMEACQTS